MPFQGRPWSRPQARNSPCCRGAAWGPGTALGGTTTPPRVVPCSKNAILPQTLMAQGIRGVFIGLFFILGTRAMQFVSGHKKTRPAVARRADFCYNGRGGRCYQHLPRVNTLGSQLHLLTVGLLYPFCVVKSRLRPPKTGGFFYGEKQ